MTPIERVVRPHEFCVWVLDCDVEHLGEMLTETMRRGCLDTSTCGWDKAFDSGGVVGSWELLVDGFGALDNGNSEQLLVDIGVPVQDLQDFGASLLLCKMCGVAFLP
jgi:hypothetical protein